MNYQVTIGGRTLTVEVREDRVLVDGVSHQAELRQVEGTPLRLLLLDGTARLLAVESERRSVWQLQRGGERVEVEAVDERTAHIRKMVGTDSARAGPPVLKAPMPGLVVRIPVEPGQPVPEGGSLVVLEAMKMENDLKAPAACVVERVAVGPGQAVERGQILMTFLPA